MKLSIFKISRPRFWLYLFGPYLIGLIAAGSITWSWPVILFGLYFLLPANLLIYGINDIFDYETDKINPKKQHYESLVTPRQQKQLSNWILLLNLPIVFLLFFTSLEVRWAVLGFLFFGLYYSMPPIRAKAKPFLDSMFNILYVFPGVVGYTLLAGVWPPVQLIVAAAFWCMAMHAYSAMPDIASDKKARVQTIATTLGARPTLLFCLVCYALAAWLSFEWLGLFSLIAGGVYAGMVLFSLNRSKHHQIFKLYQFFPYINTIVGVTLFFWVLLIVK